jgi:hypothetical protein
VKARPRFLEAKEGAERISSGAYSARLRRARANLWKITAWSLY